MLKVNINVPVQIDDSKISSFTFQQKKQNNEDKVTLKEYIQKKNVQRKLEYHILNYQKGIPTPLPEQKMIQFDRQMAQIKSFINQIVGEGYLYNKFVVMVDNLYFMFIKEITVYHKLRFQRQQKREDTRIQQFRQANDKLSSYLQNCQSDVSKVQQKLEKIRRQKQIFKLERQKNYIAKEKLKKSRMQEAEMLQDTQKPVQVKTINYNQLFVNDEKCLKPPAQRKSGIYGQKYSSIFNNKG